MQLTEGYIYHVYNRGNNKRQIFFSRDNYLYFLKTVHKTIAPCSDILAWCLMPNHFHFLVRANEISVQQIADGSFPRQLFSQQIKQLLSSYTKAINKQKKFTGSLFQQKTKAVCVNDENCAYAEIAFHYIHQNPMAAGLVNKMEGWEFSSFTDYAGLRNGSLCKKELAYSLLDLDRRTLYMDSYKIINNESIKLIE
jgi:REP element-mobilizing transposase RayT